MAEHIELEALQAFTDELIKKLRLDYGDCDQYTSGCEESAVRITKAFAANVVEVVRCRDCKYYREGDLFTGIKFCFRLKHEDRNVGYNFSDYDFCSRGERKDGANNG